MNSYLSILSGLTYGQAVQRLELEYTAAHGGGWPDALKGVTETVRLSTLKGLGFRVMRRFEMDISEMGEPPKMEQWAGLSGGIAINLTDGFVCQGT